MYRFRVLIFFLYPHRQEKSHTNVKFVAVVLLNAPHMLTMPNYTRNGEKWVSPKRKARSSAHRAVSSASSVPWLSAWNFSSIFTDLNIQGKYRNSLVPLAKKTTHPSRNWISTAKPNIPKLFISVNCVPSPSPTNLISTSTWRNTIIRTQPRKNILLLSTKQALALASFAARNWNLVLLWTTT